MLTVDKNPWIGLLSYGIKDADSFFGRDNEIETLCASIKQNYSTVIYGKSGMGKTSLINAGLIPALSGEGFFPVSIRLSHNSDGNSESLANMLALLEELAKKNQQLRYELTQWKRVHKKVKINDKTGNKECPNCGAENPIEANYCRECSCGFWDCESV